MGATRDNFIKYPRTPHLFGSKGTDDDKHLSRKESEAFIADPSLIVEESIIDASMHAPKGSGSMAGADRTALLLMGILAVQASLSFFLRQIDFAPHDVFRPTPRKGAGQPSFQRSDSD